MGEACDEYVALRDQRGALEASVHAVVCQPRIILPYLVAGRLARVKEGATDWGWGIVLAHSFKPPNPPHVRRPAQLNVRCMLP